MYLTVRGYKRPDNVEHRSSKAAYLYHLPGPLATPHASLATVDPSTTFHLPASISPDHASLHPAHSNSPQVYGSERIGAQGSYSLHRKIELSEVRTQTGFSTQGKGGCLT